MTEEQVIAFFDGKISDADVEELTAAANADPEEGVEWLPWYKMALSCLCSVVAELHTTASPASIKKAGKAWQRHLLLAGNGPDTDAERCARGAAMAHNSLMDFLGVKP